jgi:hypothetical protein
MSDRNVSFDRLTPAERTRFKTLTSAPPLGWLTLALWVLLNAAFLCSDTLGVTGRIHLWVGMLVNSLVGYVAFSVVHDSIHRAVSAHTKLNDWIGQLAQEGAVDSAQLLDSTDAISCCSSGRANLRAWPCENTNGDFTHTFTLKPAAIRKPASRRARASRTYRRIGVVPSAVRRRRTMS